MQATGLVRRRRNHELRARVEVSFRYRTFA
jgi:hypothetical protein